VNLLALARAGILKTVLMNFGAGLSETNGESVRF